MLDICLKESLELSSFCSEAGGRRHPNRAKRAETKEMS